MIKLYTILIVFVLCQIPAFAANSKQENIISLDPFSTHVVNGVGEIQAMNGLAVNGESRMEHVNETRELSPSSFKLFLYVKALNIHWKTVKKMKKTRQGWEEIMAKWRQIDFDKVVPEYVDRALGIDSKTGRRIIGKRYSPQFWQLEQLQAWNARKKIVLYFKSPHPISEKDFPAFSKYFNACVREVKKRFPDLGPLYVMIFNEPDYEYPRVWEQRGLTETISFFYKFFNYIDVNMKKEFPDVTMIGPGISKFMDWRNWKNWTKPYIQQVPNANYFNCQPYCRRFTDLLSWSEMLQAESVKTNGKRVPLVMTEANMGGMRSPASEWWKDKHHVQRVFDEARGMLGLMNHPDQFAMKHYFIYHYGHKFADMWYEKDGVPNNTPAYWLYWLFRDVRGTKTFCSVNREESPLKVVSSKDGETVTLLVFNESMKPVSAKLNVLWPEGILAPSCVVEYMRYNPEEKTFLHGTEPKQHFPQSLSFAPGEVKKLRWVYSPTKKVALREFNQNEFFSQKTGLAVNKSDQETSIAARSLKDDEMARLRMAFYLDDLLAVDKINWTFNQHELEVKYKIESYDEGRVSPIIYVDSVIPSEWVKDRNELVFKALNESSYRVMFSSIIIQQYPKKFPEYHASQSLIKKPSAVDMELVLPRFIEPGMQKLAVKLINNSNRKQSGCVKLCVPKGWELKSFPKTFELNAKESKTVQAALAIPSGKMRSDEFISVTLDVLGEDKLTVRRGTAYQVPFQAEYAELAPVIDGNLDEWNSLSFINERHQGPGVKEPFTTKLAAKWNEKNIYFAVEVDGRKLDPLPAGANYWWKHDTLEVFLDLWNSKKAERDHRTMQVWIALKNLATNKAKWETVPNDPNACILKGTSPDSFKVSVVEKENGFAMEVALDWKSLSTGWDGSHEIYKPKAGDIVGCETTLASRSLIGSKIKAYACPAKWGNLKLLKKGETVQNEAAEIILDTSIKKESKKSSQVKKNVLHKFDFSDTKDWIYPAKTVLDEKGLHLRNNHSALVLKQPWENIMPQGMTLNITLDGFEKIKKSNVPLMTDARIFLAPEKEKGTEPYIMTDMLCLLVHYREYGDITLTLLRKAAPEKNWGTQLWSGALEAGDFPVTLSLQLNESDYKIRCDKSLIPVSGSMSGKHHLPKEKWSDKLRFGIKSCFGEPANAVIKKVEILSNK